MLTHRLFLGIFLVLFSSFVNAGVTIERSRVIFFQDSFKKEINIINHNDYSVMVRVWVGDSLESTISNTNAKLLIDNPLFEMKPKEIKRISLINIDQDHKLNRDIETVYYLNIEEQGQITDRFQSDNAMAISMQTQYKIFIRPVVVGQLDDSLKRELKVLLTGKQGINYLLVSNDTPYYITVADSNFILKNEVCSGEPDLFNVMLEPKGVREIELSPELDVDCVVGVKYLTIDDDGGYESNSVGF